MTVQVSWMKSMHNIQQMRPHSRPCVYVIEKHSSVRHYNKNLSNPNLLATSPLCQEQPTLIQNYFLGFSFIQGSVQRGFTVFVEVANKNLYSVYYYSTECLNKYTLQSSQYSQIRCQYDLFKKVEIKGRNRKTFERSSLHLIETLSANYGKLLSTTFCNKIATLFCPLSWT